MLIFSSLDKFLAGMSLMPGKWHTVLVVHLCRTRFGHVHTVMSLQRTLSYFVTRSCWMLVAALGYSACLLQLQEQDLS